MKKLYVVIFFIPALLFGGYVREGEVVADTEAGLVWQDDVAAKNTLKSYEGAKNYCVGLRLENFEDWRVPTIAELEKLIDEKSVNPAIKSAFKNTANDFYWTATSGKSDGEYARSVNFYVGYQSFSPKKDELHVRCVRGGAVE